MEEFYLKDIKYNEESIVDWEFIQATADCRVYYKPFISEIEPSATGLGFNFCSVLCITVDLVTKNHKMHINEEWIPERSCVEILYSGTAHWDGLRHLYLGDEQTKNYGYIFYTSIKKHIAILNVIKELENKYCTETIED